MRVRPLLVATLAASLLLPCLVEAQQTQRNKKRKGGKASAADWLLPDASTGPSAEELTKRFPGADAVVVLDAVQHAWETDHQITTVQRRVRLLSDAVDSLNVFVPEGSGHWTVKDGSAKVVGSSGAARALDAPKAEPVDGGLMLSVDASAAAAGELVELTQTLECAHPSYPPWTLRDALPVLESRVVALPPPLLTLRAYGFGLPEGAIEPTEFTHRELTGAGWRFGEQAALESGPLAPSREQVSPRLLIAVEKYPDLDDGGALRELDWSAWGGLTAGAAKTWMDAAPKEALTAGLTEGASPGEVLKALRAKLTVTRTAAWPENASAEEALASGRGNSADLALLVAAALRARGAPAELVAVRSARRGAVADIAPVDGNFTELLVRSGESWLDPAKDGGAGALPPRFYGTRHAVLGESLSQPEAFPAVTAADNRIERQATLTLDADGRLTGSSSWSLSPFAASLAGGGATAFERAVDRSGWGARDGNTMSYGVLPWRVLQDLDLSAAPKSGDIDLGLPRTVVDVVAIELPPGVTGAKLAAPARIDAGPAGLYEREVKPDGRTVTVTRTFRLDLTRFGPDEAEALSTWLRRIQEAERATTKLQLQ